MEKSIVSFIDNDLIRQYARKNNNYNLDVNEITFSDQKKLLDLLFYYDPPTNEICLNRIQDLIEDRIPWVESQDNYDRGLKPIHDAQTGEVMWIPNRN